MEDWALIRRLAAEGVPNARNRGEVGDLEDDGGQGGRLRCATALCEDPDRDLVRGVRAQGEDAAGRVSGDAGIGDRGKGRLDGIGVVVPGERGPATTGAAAPGSG